MANKVWPQFGLPHHSNEFPFVVILLLYGLRPTGMHGRRKGAPVSGCAGPCAVRSWRICVFGLLRSDPLGPDFPNENTDARVLDAHASSSRRSGNFCNFQSIHETSSGKAWDIGLLCAACLRHVLLLVE